MRVATSSEHKGDFDGDAMHLLMIKEMDMLPTLMKLHPSLVMVGGTNLGISGDVTITKQEAINLTAWLDEEQEMLKSEKAKQGTNNG